MTHPNRRQLLTALAASPVVATGIGAYPRTARAEAASAGLISTNVCMVTPEATEGPYYFDPGLERADITEGRTGIPLTLRMQVVDSACVPLEGARVDVWHCDAEGNYSGYARNSGGDTSGETFLRGTLFTGAEGTVSFGTIYPGWYPGRTTHIHYKVFLDETTVLTSQIFFPDALSEYIYENVAPYDTRGATRDTVNTNDFIAARVGDGGYAAVREQTGAYAAELVVGVDESGLSDEAGLSATPENILRQAAVDLTNLVPKSEG